MSGTRLLLKFAVKNIQKFLQRLNKLQLICNCYVLTLYLCPDKSLLVKLIYKNAESASLTLCSYRTMKDIKSCKGAYDSYKTAGYDKNFAVQDL